MKKLLVILLAVSLLAVCAVSVNAADATGQCGDNLTWTRSGNTLTISGTGPMYDYSEENPAPWKEFSGGLSKIVIENGVTRIGDYAFDRDSFAGWRITVPATVTEIGQKAFANGHNLVIFLGSAPTFADDACDGTYGRFWYITGWEESDLQSYGGTQDWVKVELAQTAKTKTVYALNEEIKPEDFVLKATYNGSQYFEYTPRTVQTEPYDNSTCGEKNVKVVADELEFTHTYFVTDGQNHLDNVEVEIPAYQYYTGEEIEIEPVVTAGTLVLTKGVHYSLSYRNNTKVGTNAQVTVTGIGLWEGFSKTVSFHILKRNMSEAYTSGVTASFAGQPVTPKVGVSMFGEDLKAGRDYIIYYHNNVNIGTATYCVVGIGNYCGYALGEVKISGRSDEVTLKGAYNGLATGTLNDQVYYQEALVPPGVFRSKIYSTVNSTVRDHYAYYELYQVVDEELTLVTTKLTEYGHGSETEFVYDFSSVYEDAAEEGGATYVLYYSWVDSKAEVYSGIYVMYIPAKVPDATTMVVEQVTGISDFRRVYMSAYGTDGNVGDVTWTTSNPSVATVKDGVVTLKAPGTVTITGQYGNLTDAQEITVTAQDLTQGDVLCYDPQTGEAAVFYDGWLLTAGTDYSLLVSEQEGVTVVTVVGRGLFTGQLVRQFDTASADPLGHTHSFENCEDTKCGTCAFERTVAHQYSEQWQKNQTHHWHACTVCGQKAVMGQHVLLIYDRTTCSVCGSLYTPGDLTGDYSVNEDDAIYLLQHILLPDFFTVNQTVDYTGDNRVDEDDAIYLLQHVLLPEFFPL